MKRIIFTVSIYLGLFGIAVHSQAAIKVFDGTTQLANYKSAVYSVQVQQNEEPFQNSFVVGYVNDYTGIANVGTLSRMNHFTTFEFDGQIKVEITLLTGNITTAKILPDVDFEGNPFYTNKEIRDGKLYLTIPKNNEKLYVEINGNLNEPLYLFADNFSPTYSGDNVFEAPTTFNGAVTAGKNTVVFRSGKIYNITQTSGGTPNKWTIPDAVDIVNFELGAIVIGSIGDISSRTKPLTLNGPGIIWGAGDVVSGTSGIPYNAIAFDGSNYTKYASDFCIVKSRHFAYQSNGPSIVDGIKCFGGKGNNDGIGVRDNSSIKNCFLKVQDENIKTNMTNVVIDNIVFHKQANGNCIGFGFGNMTINGLNCTYTNLYVVRDDQTLTTSENKNIIGWVGSDAGKRVENLTIKNLRVYGKTACLFKINVTSKSTWKNVLFENFWVDAYYNAPSITPNGAVSNFQINNVYIGNNCISRSEINGQGAFLTLGGCSDIPAKIDNPRSNSDLMAYPNPFGQFIKIENGLSDMCFVDITGRTLNVSKYYEGSNLCFATTNLNKGIYFINIEG